MSDAPLKKRGFRIVYLLPLLIAGGLFAVFAGAFNRTHDASYIPSPLIGHAAPEFALVAPEGLKVPGISTFDLKGHGVTLVNVFASWCVPCRDEHPVLMEIAKDTRFHLVGLNYKDQPSNALKFLGDFGNPYAAVGSDAMGRTGIDFGVYGVPETFVIDNAGVIRYKFVGPLTMDSWEKILLPEVEKARS